MGRGCSVKENAKPVHLNIIFENSCDPSPHGFGDQDFTPETLQSHLAMRVRLELLGALSALPRFPRRIEGMSYLRWGRLLCGGRVSIRFDMPRPAIRRVAMSWRRVSSCVKVFSYVGEPVETRPYRIRLTSSALRVFFSTPLSRPS